ncbi:hypothetical protein D9613_010010 [Agrocybe pediades]|uniref:N-acetylglucosaminylphosphatidylinositol deacetylase n=1 Tax=Agrocybe pediades TaxID=84607 RepID=A0A8H4QX96_9AGAR|nr:hypothetical protein D9613_010010 [Agrocybe pediades]KAF9567180.1 LmbE-like protein [Agrocybe pediades]
MATTLALTALGLSVVLGSLFQPLQSNAVFATQRPAEWPVISQNLLLVTAHPDDESLFFAPTILALQNTPAVNLFHVCLSNGNAEGLGATRKIELERSLDVLGIARTKRWLVEHADLQDNQTAFWDADVIATVLKPYILNLKIDTILTFDGKGVSSHPNHMSLPAGAKALIKSLDTPVRLFSLVSSSLLVKYVSILTVPFHKLQIYSYRALQLYESKILDIIGIWFPDLLNPAIPRQPDANAMPMFISGYQQYQQALASMQAHESQLVWFRYLNVAFSTYLWVNSYLEVIV